MSYHAEIKTTVLSHQKFIALEPAAKGLWAWGLAYCQEHLTDGVIPRHVLPRLLDRPMATCLKIAEWLVERRLWESHGDAFQVHDYLEHNRSRAEVTALREAAKERAKRSRGGRDGAAYVQRTNGEGAAHVQRACEASYTPPTPHPTTPTEDPPVVPPARAPASATAAPSCPPGFGRFWEAYPKRVGKGDALRAWRTLRCEPHTDAILAALETQRAWLLREDGRYIPNPATWLNGRRWEDRPPSVPGPAVAVEGISPKTARTIANLQAWVEDRA